MWSKIRACGGGKLNLYFLLECALALIFAISQSGAHPGYINTVCLVVITMNPPWMSYIVHCTRLLELVVWLDSCENDFSSKSGREDSFGGRDGIQKRRRHYRQSKLTWRAIKEYNLRQPLTSANNNGDIISTVYSRARPCCVSSRLKNDNVLFAVR